MGEKNDPIDQAEVGQVEAQKMETQLHQDFQGPGGTETAPLKEEAATPTTMEFLPKVTEAVEDVGENFSAADVVSAAPTPPVLDPLGAVAVGWEAGVVETTGHQLVVPTTRNPRVKESVAGMVRIDLSITQPEPETVVKPAVRVQSMKKSPREGGREAQRLAVRVVLVTLVPQTKKKNPIPRMAPIIATPLAVETFHLHHPEVPRLVSSPRGVCHPGGAGVVEVEEETSTGVVAILEVQLGDTGLDLALSLTVGPPNHQRQPGSSKVHHNTPGPKTWVGEETLGKRRTR